MRETTVVLGIDEQALQEEVLHFLDRLSRAKVVGVASGGGALPRVVREQRPDVVVAVPHLLHPFEGPMTFAIATRETSDGLRAAIRAGARGFFVWPEERRELGRQIEAARPVRGAEPDERGVVVAVLGARGGAGATFLATNLAAALARSGAETVLVDLDLLYGDVSAALGIPPDTSLPSVSDLLAVAREVDVEHVDRVLHRHPAGFDVLLAPQRVPPDAGLEPEMIRGTVAALRSRFAAAVLHLPRAVDPAVRSAIELADEVLLVLTLDVLGVRAARRLVEHVSSLGLGGSFRLVVNRAGGRELVPADARRVLDLPIACVIGTDRAVERAQNRGELVMGRRGALSRRLSRLAGQVLERRAA